MSKAHRTEQNVVTVTVFNGDTWGLTLGDVRRLVESATGVPDSAEVTVEDVQSHYSNINQRLVKRMSVEDRSKVGTE